MIFTQSDFSAGLNLITSDINIATNGYYYLTNARQRFGEIEANKKAIKNTRVPFGKKQGHIGLGNILIEFIAGAAWYNLDGSNIWSKIPGFVMSATADVLYSLSVPASTFNFTRKLKIDGTLSDPLNTTNFKVEGTIAGIIVQDGVTQPFVIYQDLNTGNLQSRQIQTYTQWTLGGKQEYVPIGKQMMFLNQKVYVISPNNKYIYQSISGRPLDFMVNVDINGDKLVLESDGGAISMSFAFDSDDITCIKPCNIPDSFIYATAYNTRIITLDYTSTIFGEPTYSQTAELVVGVVNKDSVIDILGDYALIDFEGVKSFNAVKQFKWEGRNAVFSLQLSKILKDIKQYRCRCAFFNNYALFALDTAWGFVIAAFDTLLGQWVAFDIISGVSSIKEFATVTTSTEDKLYVITDNDELFQLYADNVNKESASLHTRAFSRIHDIQYNQATVSFQQKGEYFKLFFRDNLVATNIILTEYSDGQKSQRLTQQLAQALGGMGPAPVYSPVIPSTKIRAQQVTFNLTGQTLEGTKLAYVIQWSGSAKLVAIELQTSDNMPLSAKTQTEQSLQNSAYGN